MDSPFVGQIQTFGFNFAPRGWALCQGQIISIAQNNALFALLGTTYGGNGTTNFQLPDLQGRMAIGQGSGGGLTPRVIGEVSGTENVTILTNNMPAHTHVATFTPSGGGVGSVTLKASTMQATQNVPGTSGANTLAAPYDGTNFNPINGYVADANPTISLVGLSGSSGITGGTVTNSLAGGGMPITTISPFLCINYSIALQGIFPSRN